MSRGRILFGAGVAAFIAIMLAGPGAAIAPSTLRWGAWIACPAGTAPMSGEYAARHHTDETDGRFWCVAPDGTAHERTMAAMGGLALTYFMGISVLLSLLAARRATRAVAAPPLPPRPVPADAEARARELVAGGHKLHAIRLVREASGMGLKEAKDWVDALPYRPVRGGAATSAGPAAVETIPNVPLAGLTPEVEASARDLLRDGQKISAIALVRQATGMGLKEARDWVDALPRRLAMSAPAPPSGSGPSVPAEAETRARELIATGHTVSAIKVVNDATGMGLEDSKAWVEALIDRIYASPASTGAPPAGAAERLAEVKRMLDAGLITAAEYEAKKAEILARL